MGATLREAPQRHPQAIVIKWRHPVKRAFLLSILTFTFLMGCGGSGNSDNVTPPPDGVVNYRGMSYTSWGQEALSEPGSDQSLVKMRAVGVDTVSINVWEFQDNKNSTEIAPDFSRYSSSESSIRHAIRRAKSLGMKVMLKPNIDLRDGTWRAEIVPSDAWFAAYRGFIWKYATIAQQEGVDIMSIGTEFRDTEGWSDHWRGVASTVRNAFLGKITYATNHGDEQKIQWWDAVDYIGIDAYYVLSSSPDPTLSELKSVWKDRADAIEAWNLSSWNKPVLFTEAGYRSARGSASMPWDFTHQGTVDLTLQANCYDALLAEMTTRSWFRGVMWWNWETNPDAGGPLDNSFTPQGKPVEEVLRRYYDPVP
jgi:hypothetical protein